MKVMPRADVVASSPMRIGFVPDHHRRLDNPDLVDGRSHLGILDGLDDRRCELPQRQDLGEGDAEARRLNASLTGDVWRA